MDYILMFLLLFVTPTIELVGADWFLETLQLTSLAHNPHLPDRVERVCSSVPGMVPRQVRLCQSHPRVMVSMSAGARLGLGECGEQFKYSRWNCSGMQHPSQAQEGIRKMVQKATKETAFLHAISSAGVVHAVTRSCTTGNLDECECDPKHRGESRDQQGIFTWGGCSEHIRFGMKMARLFVDAQDKERGEARSEMNLHNNRVGRKQVWRHKVKMCKCHGVSGACSLRTCWRRMQDFNQVGESLKAAYTSAVKAVPESRGDGVVLRALQSTPRRQDKEGNYKKEGKRAKKGQKRRSKRESASLPRNQLVYLDDSPNYCKYDKQIGHPGISGRECNISSSGEDSCKTLCCDRGYDTFEIETEMDCDCKFYWCCNVKCKLCRERILVHRCKTLAEDDYLPTIDPITTNLTANQRTREFKQQHNKKRRRQTG